MRTWTSPIKAKIEINTISNYQRIAAKASDMHTNGATVNAIAVALMIDPGTVKQALAWAEKNDGSWLTSADLSIRRKLDNCKTHRIGPEVAQLCDEEGKSFKAIARELGTTQGTASRAYRQFRAEQNLAAIRRGEILDSGPRRKISQEMIVEIRRLLTEGKLSGRKIAKRVGCAAVTVRDERKRMDAERRADDAA